MKKIPTMFRRNPENMRELLDEPHEDCHWVFQGEGVATRKYDGTCCLIREGKFYKRREVKKGKRAPTDFVLEDFDLNTGKTVGWVPVSLSVAEDRWHVEAFESGHYLHGDGTYELLGPKVQRNPEGKQQHILLKHSQAERFYNVPRNMQELRDWFEGRDIEGVVFHHKDGRMAKIKLRDFGLKRIAKLISQMHAAP